MKTVRQSGIEREHISMSMRFPPDATSKNGAIFRQDRPPVGLCGLREKARYELIDSDSGDRRVTDGKTLMEDGFEIVLKDVRSSSVFRYRSL